MSDGNRAMDEQRLNQVEQKTDRLEQAMADLAKNVNEGFKNIGTEMAKNNDSMKDEIGKLYGRLNNHALQDAKKGQISWPLVISIIVAFFVTINFFQNSGHEREDRANAAERELRQTHDEIILLKAKQYVDEKIKATP